MHVGYSSAGITSRRLLPTAGSTAFGAARVAVLDALQPVGESLGIALRRRAGEVVLLRHRGVEVSELRGGLLDGDCVAECPGDRAADGVRGDVGEVIPARSAPRLLEVVALHVRAVP